MAGSLIPLELNESDEVVEEFFETVALSPPSRSCSTSLSF